MTHLSSCRAACRTLPLTPLLVILNLFLATSIGFAAAVGDQVELRAAQASGVPLHSALGGSRTFQRVPDGTVAAMIGLARGGRWLVLRLPDRRMGWIVARYVGRTIAGAPPPISG